MRRKDPFLKTQTLIKDILTSHCACAASVKNFNSVIAPLHSNNHRVGRFCAMKRQRVIDEIISSEETYCASLERLVNEVVIPLLTKQQLNTASVQERQPTHTRENSITTLQRLSSFTGFASLPKRFEISIKPNEHAMAFSNIREILTLSKQLLTALKQEGAQCGVKGCVVVGIGIIYMYAYICT